MGVDDVIMKSLSNTGNCGEENKKVDECEKELDEILNRAVIVVEKGEKCTCNKNFIGENIAKGVYNMPRDRICEETIDKYIVKRIADGLTPEEVADEIMKKFPATASKCFCKLCMEMPDEELDREINEQSKIEIEEMLKEIQGSKSGGQQ